MKIHAGLLMVLGMLHAPPGWSASFEVNCQIDYYSSGANTSQLFPGLEAKECGVQVEIGDAVSTTTRTVSCLVGPGQTHCTTEINESFPSNWAPKTITSDPIKTPLDYVQGCQYAAGYPSGRTGSGPNSNRVFVIHRYDCPRLLMRRFQNP